MPFRRNGRQPVPGRDLTAEAFGQEPALLLAAITLGIEATLATKLQVWGPRMGANAPKSVPLPEVLSGNTIALEGQALEILGLHDSLPQRSYVWIPS